ncbi:MAG: YbaB/EbfC family nucleoid-associated protein, partial [Lachnospiraceae bacterium]|nr:YbaB/EbfC family nucleoid-associated protein [Lachnospiraceae bacterium]
TVTGKKVLTKLTISKDAVDPDDVEMLQDMVMAAINEALAQAETANDELMRGISSGLNLSGLPF